MPRSSPLTAGPRDRRTGGLWSSPETTRGQEQEGYTLNYLSLVGAQTAQCAGAIQDPASVHTVITPLEA